MTISSNNISILENNLIYINGNVYKVVKTNDQRHLGKCYECSFSGIDAFIFDYDCDLSIKAHIKGSKYTMYNTYHSLCSYLNDNHMSYLVSCDSHF